MLPHQRQLRDLDRQRHLDWYDYAELSLRGPLGVFLDYGCGAGAFLLRVIPRCTAAYGVDVDADAVAQARQAVPAAHVRCIAPHAALPFPDQTFDHASILDVIEHVADEVAVLRELARVLRPGGILLLTTPHRGLLTFLDPGNFKFVLPGLHRFLHRRVLNKAAYYEERFGAIRRHECGMIADFTTDQQPWHRHYSYAALRRLAPAALETLEWRVYFPLMRAFCCLGIALRVLTRGRLEGIGNVPSLYGEFIRLSRVQSIAGDQLVVAFRKVSR
jgi:SAM-dependent methyltransferase